MNESNLLLTDALSPIVLPQPLRAALFQTSLSFRLEYLDSEANSPCQASYVKVALPRADDDLHSFIASLGQNVNQLLMSSRAIVLEAAGVSLISPLLNTKAHS